ncbi:MAG: hypothetical protein ABJA67_03920 [Chthonomonadales bacterium]
MSTLEDLTIHEVHCCECNKPIPAIPAWLAGATVRFQCEECRQKNPRNPGMADLEPRHTIIDRSAVDLPAVDDVEEDEDEEDEDFNEE